MQQVIGLILIFAAILFTSGLGVDLSAFIDVPALILITGIPLGVLIARHGFGSIKQLFDGQNNQPLLGTLANSALFAAIIASIIASVVLLSNLDTIKSIGPSLAVSLLSTLYAVIIFALCYAFNPKGKIPTSSALLLLATLLLNGLFYVAGFIIALFLK